MFGKIKNLVITGVLCGDSTVKAQVKKRTSHLLIYKVSGESVYYLRGNKLTINSGSVLFVPEGESYEFKKTSRGESIYYLVNFHAKFENDIPPMIVCNDKNDKILKTFKEINQRWKNIDSPEKEYEILSAFYDLIALVVKGRKNVYLPVTQKEKINPAMIYLEEHIYDADLRISTLAKLCNMSEVMFRKIFNQKFEMSPKQYIIRSRMQTANAIFESGEFENVSEVAKKVGYYDPLHFSKMYKDFFGASPTKFT